MAPNSPNLVIALLVWLLRIFSYVILARVLMSWFIRDPYNHIYRFLIRITEPVLGPIRSIMPRMGLDFSPLVAILLIQVLSRIMFSLA